METPLSNTIDLIPLLGDKPVRVPVKGISMLPFLKEGSQIEIVSCTLSTLSIGDIIFYKLGGMYIVHRYLGNMPHPSEKGDNEMTARSLPEGVALCRVVAVWEDGKRLDLQSGKYKKKMGRLGYLHRFVHHILWRIKIYPVRKSIMFLARTISKII